jgi:dTMP kinase
LNTTHRPGIFISFEGGEACGKSTQVARLAAHLRELLGPNRVITLREPGGTAIGEEIRSLLKSVERSLALEPAAELLLFAASRAQLAREIIRPALESGQIVLADRFHDSTTVYQGIARQLDPAAVEFINHFAVDGCRPDATLVLDLPVTLARERLRERAGGALSLVEDPFDAESDPFFHAVRAGYQRLVATEPERVSLIDASQPPEAVQRQVWHTLATRFPDHHGLFTD